MPISPQKTFMNHTDPLDPLSTHLQHLAELHDLRGSVASLSRKAPLIEDPTARASCLASVAEMDRLLGLMIADEQRLGRCLRVDDALGVRFAEISLNNLHRFFREALARAEGSVAHLPEPNQEAADPRRPDANTLARWQTVCAASDLVTPLHAKAASLQIPWLTEFAEAYEAAVKEAFEDERANDRARELGVADAKDEARLAHAAGVLDHLAEHAEAVLADNSLSIP